MSRLLTLILVFVLPAFGFSQVMVEINVSNPSNVTFTATTINSGVTANWAVNYAGGISFENFFTSNVNIPVTNAISISGNLTSNGTNSAFNQGVTFDYSAQSGAVVAGNDLSIYNSTAPFTDDQNFITTAPPFTGTSTIDFSNFSGSLPPVGTSGNIHVGFLPTHGGIIGQWAVVSSPGCALLASVTAQNNISCYGGNSGFITVTATNGTANYDYTWSNGFSITGSSSATSTIAGLPSGAYAVTVTDSANCISIATTTITEPDTVTGGSIKIF